MEDFCEIREQRNQLVNIEKLRINCGWEEIEAK